MEIKKILLISGLFAIPTAIIDILIFKNGLYLNWNEFGIFTIFLLRTFVEYIMFGFGIFTGWLLSKKWKKTNK